MLDRSKIYCMGCEELPAILTEIRDKNLIGVRPDLLSVCTTPTYQIAQGTHYDNDIMRYCPDPSSVDAFGKKGFMRVDPYTFAFTWLGYIPESLRASAKGKVFCRGCPELKPILTTIRKNEGFRPFPFNVDINPKYEFSQYTFNSTLGYNEGPYFGEKFGRVEVSSEVFAAIWLGAEAVKDTKRTDAPSPSKDSIPITVAKFQIKL